MKPAPITLTFTARDADHARKILEAVERVDAEAEEATISDLDVARVRRDTQKKLELMGKKTR